MITFGVKGVLVSYTVAMVTIVLNRSVKFIQQMADHLFDPIIITPTDKRC